MADRRPNILLIMTDQHRGDCLGIEDHPVLQTPCLDYLAASGIRFRRAYSACPVCIPARRTFMSGRTAAGHGVTMNYATRLDGPTLPGELAKAGYQTHLVGKLHLWPQRKRYGFDSMEWSDGPWAACCDDDYQRHLRREGVRGVQASNAHGMDVCGLPVRPWHLDDRLHFTNWCVDKAIEFLERRDPSMPFFLNVSILHPHQPLTPPQFYYDRYIRMELPDPFVGDWARVFDRPMRGGHPEPWRVHPPVEQLRQYRAAYYACINHIDDQVNRLRKMVPENTLILFCADHGEMLCDHQWIRKRTAFEGSARIPFLVKFPDAMHIPQESVRDELVELMDIMPTLLDLAGAEIPEGVDGRSLMPLLRGEGAWREYLHGECASIPTLHSGMQFVTDGRRKYIWYPGTGDQQYFNLERDPNELHNLIHERSCAEEIEAFRALLVQELQTRPEGFVKDGKLAVTGGPAPACLPGFEMPKT